MKRLIVFVIAACVIPIGVLKAVDCEFQITETNTMDCDCAYDWCYGTGYHEVVYDCPSEGNCPVCGENCWARPGGRFPNYQFTYGEPDCYTWPRPCVDPAESCVIEGYDEDTVVITDVGKCECWSFLP